MTEDWHTSSYCSKGACVHVAPVDGGVLVTGDPAGGPVLQFTRREWVAFVAGVKAGEFDTPASAE